MSILHRIRVAIARVLVPELPRVPDCTRDSGAAFGRLLLPRLHRRQLA